MHSAAIAKPTAVHGKLTRASSINFIYRMKLGGHKHTRPQTAVLTATLSLTLSASWLTARAQDISAAPPPYTTRLSRMRFRMTHRASWRDRFASSMIWGEGHHVSVLAGRTNKCPDPLYYLPQLKDRNSYHLVSSSDENGHSSRVLTLLNNQHFVFCSAK